uniref:Hemolysin E n=2 Tax=Cacopsylla melanoneura TaxID=428564 RepID=A0A8D9E797_9HEMI
MERHTVLVFLLVAIISVIASAKQVVDEGDLRDIVQKQNGMLIEYNKNLDQAVPFKELRASLKALDGLAQDYNGKCRADIYNATTMGYKATDNYFRATDKIFRWCSLTNRLTTYILDNDPPKNKVFKAMMTSTKEGLNLMKESLDILEDVRDQLTTMQSILRPIPRDLTNEITQMREDYEARKVQKRILEIALAAIGAAVTLILGFVAGPVGFALGLAGTLALAGIPAAVIEGHQIPTEDEKMRITEAYYGQLIQAVRDASGNVTAVKEKLHTEITKVQELYGEVQGATEIGEIFGELMKDDLQTLLKSVNEYMKRHGGDVKLVLKSRRIREITYHGFDVERIQQAIDHILNQTAKEREERFWELKPTFQNQPYIYQNHFNDLLKFAV